MQCNSQVVVFWFVVVLSEIKVMEADMLELPFEDECFDVVIEKGTMVRLHY